jgi:squalene-hopene/tetraprenyl-beta-curcumene cyclase
MLALAESGVEVQDSLRRGADWLLSKEVRRKGDWSVKRPNTEPSGWYFEFANEFNPDIDDSAMVMLGLAHAQASDPEAEQACHQRAVKWILDMQSKDGGWAAFDADNNWQFLSQVPFADHNAMLDPSCADITGRVLEALAAHEVDRNHPAVRRGVDYLVRTQEPDGSWYGRWGVAYIYGTCFALQVKTTAKSMCCAPASGCAPSKTPMAAGARAVPAMTMAYLPPPRALRRRPHGPS